MLTTSSRRTSLRRLLAVVALAVALLALATVSGRHAAASVATDWVTTDRHLVIGGLERSYLMARPAQPRPGRLPVVIVLHGRDMTPARMQEDNVLPPGAHAIVVYPAGYGRSWNAGACCGPAHADRIDDVTFLAGLVRDVLAREPGASADAVFLVGYSNGGRMALRMACVDPGMFAAVAAIEAVSVFPCTHLAASVSLLMVASRGDPLLVVEHGQTPRAVDGYTEPTVEDQVAQWRELNSCPARASTRTAGTLMATSWADCSRKARVTFDLYQGGSHAIPPGDHWTPSAPQETWAFFHAVRPSVVAAS